MNRVRDTESTRTPQRGIEPRRVPVQARSRERVERILDAAAQLLSDQGYDAVKTNLIAKRAGVSIGSIYQFFPNRFAIFNALADRYRKKIASALSKTMGPESPDRPWEEALEDGFESLAEMWRDDWAFHMVWLAIQNTAELTEARERYREMLINEELVYFLRRILPDRSDSRLQAIARVMLEAGNVLLDQSMRNGDAQDPLVIDELKFLMHSYIHAHVKSARATSGGPEARS
ncbi:MAG: TetR/AcrR family transcriptional regulator [Candidatus Hydrogenedentes bacterium]|nr:TetR/AcrR family transcriptional regulator [Candidatus Hydrogenedentota bacterium]